MLTVTFTDGTTTHLDHIGPDEWLIAADIVAIGHDAPIAAVTWTLEDLP